MKRNISFKIFVTLVGMFALTLALPLGSFAKQKVVVWGLNPVNPGHKVMISEFIRTHPDYEMIAEAPVGAAGQLLEQMVKLMVAISGGTGPDVTTMDRFVVSGWAIRGTLSPLTPLIERDNFPIRDFYPMTVDEASLDGVIYGIPAGVEGRPFYWNKSLYEEVGLDPEKPPVMWDDFAKHAKKLMKMDAAGNIVQVGTYVASTSWLYLVTYLNGGDFITKDGRTVTLNDPKVVESLELIVKLIDDLGGYEKLGGLTSLFSGYAEDTPNHPFLINKVGVLLGQGTLIGTIARYNPDLNYGVTWHPQVRRDIKHLSYGGGWSWVIPKGVKNMDAAWEVTKWLSTEGNKAEARGNAQYNALYGRLYVPHTSSNELINKELVDKYLPLIENAKLASDWKFIIDMMPNTRMRPVTPVAQQLYAELKRAVYNALYHKMSPKEALDAGNTVVQKELDRLEVYRK